MDLEAIATEARTKAPIDADRAEAHRECVVCHAAIERERLRAIPDVERCGGCTRHAPC
jgi:RNA polymerase-binding transcription factor DksA